MSETTTDTTTTNPNAGQDAPEPGESTLAATQASCLDCSAKSGPEAEECDHCGSDVLEYEHVSPTPLGFDDDADYHIAAGPWGAESWVYYAKDPRDS